MKTIILLTLFALMVKVFTACTGGNMFLNWGYNVSGNKVLYKNAFPNGTTEIPNADAKTFKIIYQAATDKYVANSDYATDKKYVYYGGNVIAGSDGNSFKIISHDFAKDKNQCYYHGKIIPTADPVSFVIKDETFSIDKNNIYKEATLLDNNASLFNSFNNGLIVQTTNAVSVFDAVIPLPAASTFKYISFNYFAINNQVYFHEKPMAGVNVSNFKPLDADFSTTSNHVYYTDQIIENANPATYLLIQSPYGKDDKHVFFLDKTIKGADPISFEILNMELKCSRDKHAAYKEEVKIKNVSAQDLINKNKCVQCSWDSIHFEP